MNIHLYTIHFSLTMCFVTLLLSKLCTCAYTYDFPSEPNNQQCHMALQIQELQQKKSIKQPVKKDVTKPRNSETPKQRNNETAIFFQLFFLNTETHKDTNSADIGSLEKFVASAKRVSRLGYLDVQSIH